MVRTPRRLPAAKIVLAVAFAVALGAAGAAEAAGFKPGDRIECDWLQNGTYDTGTVVPFGPNDLDQSGRWYRVKLDKDKIPNSTVECMAGRMRARAPVAETPRGSVAAQPSRPPQGAGGEVRGGTARAAKFKPGDRVECDKAQIGVWEKGTVVPLLPGDADTGRFYRVKIDGYKLFPGGIECLTTHLRPLAGAAAARPSGRFRVGEAVEALNANNSWLPARIVSQEGGFYKVRFEGRDARYDESVDEQRLRPAGTLEKEAAHERGLASAPSPAAGGPAPRSLPGTAWKIDYGRGVTGALFLFCRTGTWSNVHPNASIGAVGKSFSVSGNTLTTVNRDDGMAQRWQMSWKGDVLELFDGKVTFRLHYNGPTQCR